MLLNGALLRRRSRFPVPFSDLYAAEHRALVREALSSPGLSQRFARRQRLPLGYGVGLDERVVEYPWLLARRPSGTVLDAGSTLNHEHILRAFVPLFSSLTIVTLAAEENAYPELGVSYTYADLRALPFEDETFDTVVSLSTLEHVGMDNTRYGAAEMRAKDPESALLAAVGELIRVLRPGGSLFVTVPYGEPQDFGWFRQLDKSTVTTLVDLLGAGTSLDVYRYRRSGWQLSSLEDAEGARYRDSTVDKERPRDLAVAARAVACLHATRRAL